MPPFENTKTEARFQRMEAYLNALKEDAAKQQTGDGQMPLSDVLFAFVHVTALLAYSHTFGKRGESRDMLSEMLDEQLELIDEGIRKRSPLHAIMEQVRRDGGVTDETRRLMRQYKEGQQKASQG